MLKFAHQLNILLQLSHHDACKNKAT